jgi:hypothetical protein
MGAATRLFRAKGDVAASIKTRSIPEFGSTWMTLERTEKVARLDLKPLQTGRSNVSRLGSSGSTSTAPSAEDMFHD